MPKPILLNITSELHARLKACAKDMEITVSAFVRNAAEVALDQATGDARMDWRGQINAMYEQLVLGAVEALPANVQESVDALTQMGLTPGQAHQKVMRVVKLHPDLESQEIIAKAFRYEE